MSVTSYFDFISSTLAKLKRRVQQYDDGSQAGWMYLDDAQIAVLAAASAGALSNDQLRATPLPTADLLPSGVTPLTGTSPTTSSIGPYAPVLGRLIVITLTGTGTGQLLRSADGGATKLPITQGGAALGPWNAPYNEASYVETEAAATLYLALTGTASGRIAQ